MNAGLVFNGSMTDFQSDGRDSISLSRSKLLGYSLVWSKATGFDPVIVGSNPTASSIFVKEYIIMNEVEYFKSQSILDADETKVSMTPVVFSRALMKGSMKNEMFIYADSISDLLDDVIFRDARKHLNVDIYYSPENRAIMWYHKDEPKTHYVYGYVNERS